jgi:hypothetical protein
MITYFQILIAFLGGILIGLGTWLACMVSINHEKHEIPNNNPRNSERNALPEKA